MTHRRGRRPREQGPARARYGARRQGERGHRAQGNRGERPDPPGLGRKRVLGEGGGEKDGGKEKEKERKKRNRAPLYQSQRR